MSVSWLLLDWGRLVAEVFAFLVAGPKILFTVCWPVRHDDVVIMSVGRRGAMTRCTLGGPGKRCFILVMYLLKT